VGGGAREQGKERNRIPGIGAKREKQRWGEKYSTDINE
jgi:hypothetical protein